MNILFINGKQGRCYFSFIFHSQYVILILFSDFIVTLGLIYNIFFFNIYIDVSYIIYSRYGRLSDCMYDVNPSFYVFIIFLNMNCVAYKKKCIILL